MKPYRGPPIMLGGTAPAQVRLLVWCRGWRHHVEPDPTEQAARYGAAPTIRDWAKGLRCSQCAADRSISCSPAGR
jgi:hypothetical protein